MTEPIAGGYILPQQFYTLDVALCWCLFRLRSCYRTRDQSPYTKTNCSINANFWPRVLDPRSYCTTILPVPFRSVPERSGVFFSILLGGTWSGYSACGAKSSYNSTYKSSYKKSYKPSYESICEPSYKKSYKPSYESIYEPSYRSANRASKL